MGTIHPLLLNNTCMGTIHPVSLNNRFMGTIDPLLLNLQRVIQAYLKSLILNGKLRENMRFLHNYAKICEFYKIMR